MNPPPPDFVGYEALIAFLREHRLDSLDGDLIEIGAFMGGGTVKLAAFTRMCAKKVFVVDVFDPALDRTVSPRGATAQEVYLAFLQGRSMWDVYREATAGFDNIVTIRKDSRKVRFGKSQKFCFGFVDGCHQEAFVLNDFRIIWPRLVKGGAIGFHDWEFEDWPEVTQAVKRILTDHAAEIARTAELECGYGIRSLILFKK